MHGQSYSSCPLFRSLSGDDIREVQAVNGTIACGNSIANVTNICVCRHDRVYPLHLTART